MIASPSLNPNETIGIVAPGRKIKTAEVDTAVKVLEAWGLRVKLSKNLFSSKHGYLAGSDEERLEDLQSMIDDPDIKAIVCARGGYGSTRILDRLNLDALHQNPKWIVGFSDITAIHLKLFSQGFQSIHGTMPVLFGRQDSQVSVAQLKNVLFGDHVAIEAPKHAYNRLGNCRGQTVGGNLSLIVDALSTPTQLDTKNKILILEEIDEYSYRLDRMMVQMKRAGQLERLAALVIGHFTDIKDTEVSFGESPQEIIMHAIRDYQYPVAFGFPIGHENPNLAWKHGSNAMLSITDQGAMLSYD